MNPNPYAPSGQSMNQMFINTLIEKKAVEGLVVRMFPQLNIWNLIAKRFNAPKVKVGNRRYQMQRLGNTYVAAQIQTTSVSNGQCILTFNDNTYDAFRIGDGVRADSGVIGVVAQKQPGKIWLDFQASPITGVTAFDSGVDFQVGETASSVGDISNVNNPNGAKERLVEETIPFYNYVQQIWETASITANEAAEETYLANVGGKTYQLDAQIKAAMLRVNMNYAVRCYTGIQSNVGGRIMADGLTQQINTGGGYKAALTGDLTESSLQGFMDGMIANGGLNGNSVICVAGYKYIGAFQRNIAKGLTLYPGKENTVGVKEGINGFEYAYNGLKVEFILDPLFQNTNAFPPSLSQSISTFANTGYWISTAETVTNNGTVPFMHQKYYLRDDMIIAQSNGILDENGNIRTGMTNGKLEADTQIIYNKTLQLTNPAACGLHQGTN